MKLFNFANFIYSCYPILHFGTLVETAMYIFWKDMGQVLCWNEHFGLISNLYDKKNPLISVETDAEYGQDQNWFEDIGQLLSNFDKGLYLQKANTYLTWITIH